MVTLGLRISKCYSSKLYFFVCSRRGVTLQEALEMAYDDDVEAVFIEPPNSNVLTDEDSGDEDEGGTINNLSGPQLRAPAEVKLKNNKRITEPKPSTSSSSVSSKKEARHYEWIDGDLYSQKRDFSQPDLFTI